MTYLCLCQYRFIASGHDTPVAGKAAETARIPRIPVCFIAAGKVLDLKRELVWTK